MTSLDLSAAGASFTSGQIDESTILPISNHGKPGSSENSQAGKEGAGQNSGTFVQVPIGIWTMLQTRLDGLESQVLSLQGTVDALKRNQTVEVSVPAKLWYFPRLPIEIRELIWGHYTDLPRIISIHPEVVMKPNPRYNVKHATKPWRSVGKEKLIFDKYIIKPMNQDCVLKLVSKESSAQFRSRIFPMARYDPEYHILWKSDKYETETVMGMDQLLQDLPPGSKIRTVAMSYDQWLSDLANSAEWNSADFGRLEHGSLFSNLRKYGIRNIIVAVGDLSLSQRHDVEFIPPRLSPGKLLELHEDVNEVYYGAISAKFGEMVQSDKMEDWQNLVKHSTDQLQRTLKKTSRRRERKLSRGITKKTLKKRNADNTKYKYMHECKHWEMPNITFMQITTAEQERARARSG